MWIKTTKMGRKNVVISKVMRVDVKGYQTGTVTQYHKSTGNLRGCEDAAKKVQFLYNGHL